MVEISGQYLKKILIEQFCIACVIVQAVTCSFLESIFFAKSMRFFVALSLEVIEDNGQTIQRIMDKAFVCLCVQ